METRRRKKLSSFFFILLGTHRADLSTSGVREGCVWGGGGAHQVADDFVDEQSAVMGDEVKVIAVHLQLHLLLFYLSLSLGLESILSGKEQLDSEITRSQGQTGPLAPRCAVIRGKKTLRQRDVSSDSRVGKDSNRAFR